MSEARRKRGDVTRERLMRAAELLIAQHGIENVTVRAIVAEADQKNESALQYHFKNKEGLLNAIHQQRNAEIRALRTKLLQPYLTGQVPELRDICQLMVVPAYPGAGEYGIRLLHPWLRASYCAIIETHSNDLRKRRSRKCDVRSGSHASTDGRNARSSVSGAIGKCVKIRRAIVVPSGWV
jgi:AcrR family transcriptional regulator